MAALDLSFKTYKPEGVLFKLATLTKKRKPGNSPKELFFGGFPEDRRLCVVQCLRRYEECTQQYRNQDNTRVFISYVKPHARVTPQRIAKWIKVVIGEAGIDSSIFSAHSTRGASSTAAAKQGVPTEEILRMADWSQENTFRKFYYRPDRDPTYGQQVLRSGQHTTPSGNNLA